MYRENQKINDEQARDFNAEISRLANANMRNLEILEDAKYENDLLLQKNAQLQKSREELDIAVQLMDQEIQEISNMERHLRNKLSEIDAENKELVLSVDQNRDKRDVLSMQIRDLESKLTVSANSEARLVLELNNLQGTNESFRRKQDGFDAREQQYLDQLSTLDRKNAALESRLGLLQGQRLRFRNDIIAVIEEEDDRDR